MLKELAGGGRRLTLFHISATGSLAVPLLKITTLLHTEQSTRLGTTSKTSAGLQVCYLCSDPISLGRPLFGEKIEGTAKP